MATKADRKPSKTVVSRVLQFKYFKETPGALVYKEVISGNDNPSADDMLVGQLYIRKAQLAQGSKIPEGLEVVVTLK